MNSPGDKPPSTLQRCGRDLWKRVQSAYGITDPEGLLLLSIAAQAADRVESARRKLAAEGLTIKDRFAQARLHPAVRAEQAARAQMLQALRQLNLDPGPAARGGKPYGGRGRNA
jgi:P27 family predicted phage terminase small subunit